jgi:DNA repair and recombination protein RAD54B
MGSTTWTGELLCAGYSAYISGKELQLDCEISGSQLPDMKEISLPEESTSHVEDPLNFGSQWSMANPSVAQKFISPASFYASPKSKPKGPLSVISSLIPLF